MSRMFAFLLTLFPRLTMLFYLYWCPPLLCFSLVPFFLFFEVGFEFRLTPFRGCLNLILCSFICYIRFLKPSRMRSGFSLTPWPNCSGLNKRNNMVHFPPFGPLAFVLYLKRFFKCSSHEVYGERLVFSSKIVIMCLMCTSFSPLVRSFSTTHFCWCLTLRRANEYSHAAIALYPMMPIIPLENIVTTLRELHPLPSNLVLPPTFDYQLKHTFVLDRTLFAQILTTTPHLSSSGLFGMHGIWTSIRMFHTRRPILKVFIIILSYCYYYSWGYP
jgi:hypothetical protein